MMIKKLFGICENKGCFKMVSTNQTYLKKDTKDGKTINVRICEKCFRNILK